VSVLYEEHYASLVRLAALLVHDTASAEVIVQDSFVAIAAAWRRRGHLDHALDFLRQSVLERSRSGRYRSSAANGSRSAAAHGSANGSASLLAALGALPARQREVLVMRYYANLSEEQTADAIGISRAAVRRHATRANAALRTLLDAN
jgi:RNA polymerase sigma factor (sigma-70 family)